MVIESPKSEVRQAEKKNQLCSLAQLKQAEAEGAVIYRQVARK
jgi:hypothetical protein